MEGTIAEAGRKLYLIDSLSTREVLSVDPNTFNTLALSREDRLMYFHVTVTEADIWLATIE